jgi:hypothetical protein
MLRGLFLVTLALAGCGARTGLGALSLSDAAFDASDADLDADAATDAGPDAGTDAAPDAAKLLGCPLSEPEGGTTCDLPSPTSQCVYVATLAPVHDGLVGWCCNFGGWVQCATVSEMSESCTQINCTTNVPVACIVGGGSQCCVCSSPNGPVDQCGPCPE